MWSNKSFENKTTLIIQGIFIGLVLKECKDVDFKNDTWITSIARNIICISLFQFINEIIPLLYKIVNIKKICICSKELQNIGKYLYLIVPLMIINIYYGGKLFERDYLYLLIACVIVCTVLNMVQEKSTSISYGVGMACSYFEGYLTTIIPNDGASFDGFLGNISRYESTHGVVFPAKKLFLILSKDLFSPPDLKEFNKPNREDLPYLEACQPLDNIERDVAGVKNRSYLNACYKIHRPNNPNPVYVAVECATPLHTLYKVKGRKSLYKELMNADYTEIVSDFSRMLQSILDACPDCRNKCELIEFDNADSSQNLASCLLQRIEEINPNINRLLEKS